MAQSMRPPFKFSVRDYEAQSVYEASFNTAYDAIADAKRFLAERDRPRDNQSCHIEVMPTRTYIVVLNRADNDAISDNCNDDVFTDRIFIEGVDVGYNLGKNLGTCDCDNGMGSDGKGSQGTLLKGDPIDVATGNKFEEVTDYQAPDDRLTFRRFYNSAGGSTYSRSAFDGLWRHTFERGLELLSLDKNGEATGVRTYRPDGRFSDFSRLSDGRWSAGSDVQDQLKTVRGTDGKIASYTFAAANAHEVERYSADGLLLSVEDAQSGQPLLTLTYGAVHVEGVAQDVKVPVVVEDAKGRALSFGYDTKARLATLAQPDGTVLTYSYDPSSNRLVSVSYADGSHKQYLYDEPEYSVATNLKGALTGVVDELGVRFETTTFDSAGRATSTFNAGGADKLSIAYGVGGYEYSRLTGPLGGTTDIRRTSVQGAFKIFSVSDPCGAWCRQPWSSYSYNSAGNVTDRYDFNGTRSTMSYDSAGLLTLLTEASGTTEQRSTALTWDSTLRVPLTIRVSDAKGTNVAKRSFAYNARGQVLAECATDPSLGDSYVCGTDKDAPVGVRQTRYTYCDAADDSECPVVGLLRTIDGPRTDVEDVTAYRYYASTEDAGCSTAGGPCHHKGDLFQVTDATGHSATIVAYDKAGRVARRTDTNGVITDIAYSIRGWPTTIVVRERRDGTPSAADAQTSVAYSVAGTLIATTDPDGVTYNYGYDAAHRLIEVIDQEGNRIHFTLDAMGNRVKEEIFDIGGVSRFSKSRAFDGRGNLIRENDGSGRVVFDADLANSYDRNGNLLQSKNALGVVQKRTYDALNRVLTSVADAGGPDLSTKNATMSFAFDALDQLKVVTDSDGLSTTFERDGLLNLNSVVSPDTGRSSSTFDSAGTLVTRTDANGTVERSTFDPVGRVTSTGYSDGTTPLRFEYDETDGITGCTGSYPIGRLTRVIEGSVTTVFCYDFMGRVTGKRQSQATNADWLNYAYTKAGRLAALATPSGAMTEYRRNTLGQISAVTFTSLNGAVTHAVNDAVYLPFGPIAAYTLADGSAISRRYDVSYRVTDINDPMMTLHYERDALGHTMSLTSAIDGTVEYYRYDRLQRLVSVDDSQSPIETYSYTKNGSRLTKFRADALVAVPENYVYTPKTHWLAATGAGSRSHDPNGSTIAIAANAETRRYRHDGRGRLVSMSIGEASPTATYAYNWANQRIAKATSSGVERRFVYDESGLLVGEYGAVSRDFVWLDGIPVTVVDGDEATIVHSDALNSPRVVSDIGGHVVWHWPLPGNSFGERQPISTAGYELNLRFPGQYYDGESKQVYNGRRYYDSTIGQFLQSDPIGLAAGPDTYGYVQANPINSVDPSGLDAVVVVDKNVVMTPWGYAGHAGVLVGSDAGGWNYYVKKGVNGAGVQEDTKGSYGSLKGFFSSDEGSRYIDGERFATSPAADASMRAWADTHLRDPYSALRNNCADFVYDVLEVGGLPVHKPHLNVSYPNDILDPGGAHIEWNKTQHTGVDTGNWHPGIFQNPYL